MAAGYRLLWGMERTTCLAGCLGANAARRECLVRLATNLLRCDLLDVRQLPSLVEESFGGGVSTEHDFESAPRFRRHPIRLLAGGRRGSEVEVQRTIGVPLHL